MGAGNRALGLFSRIPTWLGLCKSAKAQEIEPGNQLASRRVIWDAADNRSFLSSRRGFTLNIAVALLGLPSLAAEQAAQRHLRNRPPRMRLAGPTHTTCPSGQSHSDSYDDSNVHQDACS